jgi:hypothetical protein
MEFDRNDRVVRLTTGEFATVLQKKDVTAADGRTVVLYEVKIEDGRVLAWEASDVALWLKYTKTGFTAIPSPKP